MNPFQKVLGYLNQIWAIGILLLLSTCTAGAQGVQGTWQGTLHAPNGDLPLVFHLGANGSGTVDSPAQNFHNSLQYSVNGNQITITVSSVNGTYSGTVNGKQMNGTWSQNGQSLPLTLTQGAGGGGGGAGGGGNGGSGGVQGTWQGTLHAPNGDLPLVFHLGANGSGTVDSPAQNFHNSLQYSVNGNQITITVSSVNGTYSGTVNGKQMNGTWSQNGQGLSLALTEQ